MQFFHEVKDHNRPQTDFVDALVNSTFKKLVRWLFHSASFVETEKEVEKVFA